MVDETLDSFKNRMSDPFGPGKAEADPDCLTLAQMDGKHGTMRPTNKPIDRLHVIMKDGRVITFQNMYLDVRSEFTGGMFTLIFAGTKHWEVTVEGRGSDFWRVYDYLTIRRWPYLREETRDFGDDKTTVFTKITITDVTPREEESRKPRKEQEAETS